MICTETFVIWDKKKNKLFGARDIFGIKPLYYYPMADAGDGAPGVLFGSEIKIGRAHV